MVADRRLTRPVSPADAEPETPTHVLYHGNCPDGFGGAWAAWLKHGDAATYIPLNHGTPPPALPADAVVVMIDIAFPRPEVLELAGRVKRLRILDHHKSAQDELGDLPFATFDMQRSGAMMGWDYFHPDREPPPLIRYVQDRDLWTFALPETHEITAALGSYPMDFAAWSGLTIASLADEGAAILRFRNQTVESIVGYARWGDVGGYRVPVVNATAHWSEVGAAMLAKFPEAPFVGAWFEDSEGIRRWSLRSRKDFDVSEVAKALGGGGHPQASGFRERRRG